jgi:hypothetical protein
MATPLSNDTLTQAFLAYRHDHPVDSNRQPKPANVATVVRLRLDTKNPTICHLVVDPNSVKDATATDRPFIEEKPRRIDPSQPLEKIAESLVLYPTHTMNYDRQFKVPAEKVEEATALLPGFKQELAALGLRDVFVTDTGKIYLHVENDQNKNCDLLMEKVSRALQRQTNLLSYLTRQVGLLIMADFAEGHGSSEDRHALEELKYMIDPTVIEQVRRLHAEHPAQAQQLKERVEGNDDIPPVVRTLRYKCKTFPFLWSWPETDEVQLNGTDQDLLCV